MANERSMNEGQDRHADVTVLLCTWNRARLLGETLDSLARMQVPSELRWEVLVVDNNSTDDTADVVHGRASSFPAPLRYLFERRQGKSCAMNAGIRTSSAPILAFADD